MGYKFLKNCGWKEGEGLVYNIINLYISYTHFVSRYCCISTVANNYLKANNLLLFCLEFEAYLKDGLS